MSSSSTRDDVAALELERARLGAKPWKLPGTGEGAAGLPADGVRSPRGGLQHLKREVGEGGEQLPEVRADPVGRDQVLRADEAVDRAGLPAGRRRVEVMRAERAAKYRLAMSGGAGQGAAVYAASNTS